MLSPPGLMLNNTHRNKLSAWQTENDQFYLKDNQEGINFWTVYSMKLLLDLDSFWFYMLKFISYIQYLNLNIFVFLPCILLHPSPVDSPQFYALFSKTFSFFYFAFYFSKKKSRNPSGFLSKLVLLTELNCLWIDHGSGKEFLNAGWHLNWKRTPQRLESNRIGITKTFVCWILHVPASQAVS